MHPPAAEQVGEPLQLGQGELRGREDHHVDAVLVPAERPVEVVEIGPADAADALRPRVEDVVEVGRFRGDPDHVEHRHRAVARERGAEVLERVGGGGAVDARDHRHVPVGVDRPPDDRAEGAPVVQRLRPRPGLEQMGAASMAVEVAAVARRASGQPGADGRRPALEVAARAAYAVGVDDHPGVAEGRVLAEHRRGDGLVVDAGVGHEDAQRAHGVDGPLLQGGPLVLLPEPPVGAEVDAAGVGDGGHAHAPFRLAVPRQRLQVLDPRLPEGFRIRHDVGLADLHEIRGVEHAADAYLQLQRPAPRLAVLSGEHGPLFVVQSHPGESSRASIEHGLDPGRHREAQVAAGDGRFAPAVEGDRFGLAPPGRGVHCFRAA